MMADRINRSNWLEAGFECLAAAGPDAVRIMPIAEQLGVTKGSFYWHFENLDDFHAAMLAEWERRHTHEIIDENESAGGDATAKLLRLLTRSTTEDKAAQLTFSFRLWAMTNERVKTAIYKVDDVRHAYVVDLLCQVGWDKRKSDTLARFARQAVIGRQMLGDPPLSKAQIALIHSIFLPT